MRTEPNSRESELRKIVVVRSANLRFFVDKTYGAEANI